MFWDDNDFILNNQFIKNWHYLPKYFSENIIAGAGLLSNYWRPVLLFVFSLQWHLWQDWPAGYHFINASFHITDTILLYFLLFSLFKKRWLAGLTALIFLAHPLQTEAVSYVSGLGDSLSTFFLFLSIIFYLKHRLSQKPPSKSSFYFLSLLMYPLALMAKETAFVTPLLIFIVDFFQKISPSLQTGLFLRFLVNGINYNVLGILYFVHAGRIRILGIFPVDSKDDVVEIKRRMIVYA
jgi:hypothetical protein